MGWRFFKSRILYQVLFIQFQYLYIQEKEKEFIFKIKNHFMNNNSRMNYIYFKYLRLLYVTEFSKEIEIQNFRFQKHKIKWCILIFSGDLLH